MRLIGGHTVSARAARRQERLASRPGDRDVCRPVHRDRVGVLGCYRHLGLPAAWAERDRDGLLALAGRTAHRRLARDYERDRAISEAMIRWAAINTMTRRLARGRPATRQQRRTFPALS